MKQPVSVLDIDFRVSRSVLGRDRKAGLACGSISSVWLVMMLAAACSAGPVFGGEDASVIDTDDEDNGKGGMRTVLETLV